MIDIQYFGRIRDELQCAHERIQWNGSDTDHLLNSLRARGEPWLSALSPERVFKVVLNQQILHNARPIPDEAKVVILPPVTGG